MTLLSKQLNNIADKYKDILKESEPYVLTFPGNLDSFNLSPFGVDIPQKNILSCIDSKNADFFNALQTLDKLSFGPVGMPMEKWVFFDCGEMPGGVFGLALPAEKVGEEVLKQYGLDSSYKGIVPISMYIAIPMAKQGSWFGHNLCSANSFLGDKFALSGLALLTKALGIKTFNIKECFGATQWTSGALNIHLQLADMEIRSAFTPAHSFDYTITYKSMYTDDVLMQALSGEARYADDSDIKIDASDEESIRNLQTKIEDGEKFTLMGRPIKDGSKTYLPINKG